MMSTSNNEPPPDPDADRELDRWFPVRKVRSGIALTGVIK
jgi:hypothetical protein